MSYKIPSVKSKRFQRVFKVEKKEHPSFSKKQVEQIVKDHFKQEKKEKEKFDEIALTYNQGLAFL